MSAADHALSPLAARAAAHAVQTLAPGQALTLRPARAGVLHVQRGAGWATRRGPHPANAGVLRIESRGCGVEVGRHLGAEEKASLHEALAGALARARRPDFDNPQLR